MVGLVSLQFCLKEVVPPTLLKHIDILLIVSTYLLNIMSFYLTPILSSIS